ncbi:MAG: mandelate racemase/muconate lactonizing enzyme family protein [Chloroflexi bacterium]|nr:mandelate racemase/muconate lactonizing enzyme family protein [Chloroflexota bacterium]
MRITDVRTASIRANFDWVLVRVYTDDGLVGLGEAYWGAGVEAIVRRLKALVVGEDPHNVDWLYQKMVRGMSGAGSTGGATVAAISGVELALWDVVGKALGTPIYNLLGGRYRDRIRVYADCGHGDAPTPEAWAERAASTVEKGFTAIKFDIDNVDPACFADAHHVGVGRKGWLQCQQQPISNREMDRILELVGAVREAIGPHIDLALDCHWNYNPRDVITLARHLEPFRLMWLEDPTPPDNVEALKRVTDASPVPICTGENHYTRHGIRPLITEQAVDIVQPDIPKMGGLLEAKKVADLADIYYIPVAAHNVCSPIGTVAACHTCASMRNFSVLEFHGQDVEWWNEMLSGSGALIEDGYITLPDGPGLGVELNEALASAHLCEDSTFFA